MKYFILFTLITLSSCSFGQGPKKLTELEQEKLKRITLQQDAIQKELEPVQSEGQALAASICKRAGIELSKCHINVGTGEITAISVPDSKTKEVKK